MYQYNGSFSVARCGEVAGGLKPPPPPILGILIFVLVKVTGK